MRIDKIQAFVVSALGTHTSFLKFVFAWLVLTVVNLVAMLWHVVLLVMGLALAPVVYLLFRYYKPKGAKMTTKIWFIDKYIVINH